ncbi:hypothetical protein GGI07_004910 [Coemansia sp. Benny D115]|nr:hypothetical protein GGI07_004910 [Coemansia sp. Benny D115]
MSRGAGSSRMVARDVAQYSKGVSVRWSHASVIADQTMYIIGGKSGQGNTEADYATSCLSLNLANRFSTDNAPWGWTCDNNGPLVAGHSAAINSQINMAVVYGGTVPDNTKPPSPVHLFSAEIGFWSTPEKPGFPLSLVGHTAVMQDSTGDMVVFGGVSDDASQTVSNSTLVMITDTERHGYVLVPPPLGFTNIAPTKASSSVTKTTQTKTSKISGSATPSGTQKSSHTPAPSSLPSSNAESEKPTESETPTASSLSTKSVTSKATVLETTTTTTTKSTSTKEIDARGLELLYRRNSNDDSNDDDNGPQLMSWSNETLPSGVTGRVGHTASIVGDSSMVIIGGSSGKTLVSMSVIYVYNAPQRQWARRVATGKIPASRRNHVATVVNGTLIVVHGGANQNLTKAMADVAVLDTDTWSWSAPSIPDAPAARYAHTACQAGPYMLLAFGRTNSSSSEVVAGDPGLYILDTSIWQYVKQFDPSRSGLVVHYRSTKLAGATIFCLFVASATGLCVLLIMCYIGLMHYFNKHPQLSDSGESAPMMTSAELRSLGRRLTSKLGTHGQHGGKWNNNGNTSDKRLGDCKQLVASGSDKCHMLQMYESTPSSPAFSQTNNRKRLSDISKIGGESSPRIMFDLDKGPSFDTSFVLINPTTNNNDTLTSKKSSPRINGDSRLSRRTHLDDVQLPKGLHNREDLGTTDDDSSDDDKPTTTFGNGNMGNWSRPTTAQSQVSQRSRHISAMLPHVVGSRLTLPTESASALARYRFEELEDNTPTMDYDLYDVPPTPKLGNGALVDVSLGNMDSSDALVPPVMPAAYEGAAAPYGQNKSGDKNFSSGSAGDGSGHPNIHPRYYSSSAVRDSIDINSMFATTKNLYTTNPDN